MKEKINSKYGEIFAELRDAAGKTLTDFKKIGISQASLSKFENGESLLHYDKLMSALRMIHVEETEYSLMVNDFKYDDFEVIMKEVISFYHLNDINGIQKRFAESTKVGQRRIALACSAILNGKLTVDEVDELREKFFTMTTWTYFNLQVLSLTIDQFEEKLALSFMKDFWRKNFHYRNRTRYRVLIVQSGHKLAESLIKKSKMLHSKVLLDHLEDLIQEEDLLSKICQKFERGYHEFRFSSPENGIHSMSLAVKLLAFLDYHELHQYYEKRYQEILEVKA
jgi:Rgg/GadR/MutR family transcriptional activator